MYPQILEYKHIGTSYSDSIKQIGFFAEKYLRYLPREIPDFPSHGPDHSINLVNLINEFIDNWDADLSEEEIFLLFVSAWVHDIGCLLCREDHQKHSITILEGHDIVKELLGKELYTCLKFIVKYHSSNEDINEVPREWGDVKLQKVCSIFRILDACDITEIKCPRGVYNVLMSAQTPLNPEADKYWNAHMNVESLKFDIPKIKIFIDDYDKCILIIEKLKTEINDVKHIFSSNSVTCPVVDPVTIVD